MARKSNIWLILGIGCVVILLVGIAVVGGIGYLGYKTVKDIEDGVKNPGPKAREMLGIEAFPEGYFPAVAFSVPFLFEMVMLTDQAPKIDENGNPDVVMGEKSFMYFSFISLQDMRNDMDAFFDGTGQNVATLRENGVNLDIDEVLENGVVQSNGYDYKYVVTRSDVQMDQVNSVSTERGLLTMIQVPCAGNKIKFAIWTRSEQGNGQDLSGTVGDPAELERMLGHFKFCSE